MWRMWLLFDPRNPTSISRAMADVLLDTELRQLAR